MSKQFEVQSYYLAHEDGENGTGVLVVTGLETRHDTIEELGIDTTQYAEYDEHEQWVVAQLQDFIDNANVGDQHIWIADEMSGWYGKLIRRK